jgi:hypothetical protein
MYIFMLVLAIDVVYTYFNSIDFNNHKKFLTQITDPLEFLMIAYV